MAVPSRLVKPRWGYQTTLFQLRNPAFWVFMVLLLLGLLDLIAVLFHFASISPASLALSWILMAIYAIPLLLFLYYLDLYEREPVSLVVGAFLWGALVATMISGFGNEGWGLVVKDLGGPEFAIRWTAALTAPIVEEIAKACGVVLIYLIARAEFDDVMDGFVFGATVGLGFAVVENVFYFFNAFGGSVEGVVLGFLIRVVLTGVYGHVLYTGLAGIGIAYFVTHRGDRRLGRRLAVAIGLSMTAVFAHFLWNSPLLDFFPPQIEDVGDFSAVAFAGAIKGLPFLAFGFLMVILSLRRERHWLHSALADEPQHGSISLSEMEDLARPLRRLRARRELRRVAGRGAAGSLGRLQRAQLNLAMVRTRVDEGHPDLLAQRRLCVELRSQLARIG